MWIGSSPPEAPVLVCATELPKCVPAAHSLVYYPHIRECHQAITPLIDRHAPGIVHLLLSSSLQHTPFAALSRPVAGTIKNTLVVTLPGSVKAVKENLDALIGGGVIDHAIDLVKGGSGKQVHAQIAANPGSPAASGSNPHHHHHHHHEHSHQVPQPRTTLSHDPSLPGTRRPIHVETHLTGIISVCAS